jgi:hypothetical protein
MACRCGCRRRWASWSAPRRRACWRGRSASGVLHELMEEELEEVVGPKGRHDPDRVAVRHGQFLLHRRSVPVGTQRARRGGD